MLSIAELPNKVLSYQSEDDNNNDTVHPSSEAEEEEEFDKLVSDAGDEIFTSSVTVQSARLSHM
jgi:hypothetical protein